MAGQPRKFQSVDDLQEQIDLYFAQCAADQEIPTITGLAYALDTTRRTLIDYEREYEPEYSHTIKRAKARIERGIEQLLLSGKAAPAGPIFNLKNNFGWVDEKTNNQNIQGSIGVTGTRVVFKDSDGSNAEGL